MRLKAIIPDPTPYTENKREAGLTSNSPGFPLLSRETPVRPLLRQHFIVPGPALEGPAKPSTAESGLLVGIMLTGPNEGNTLASYRPSYGDGPTGMPATKSSGEAGQGGEGDDKSDAPNTEIVSSREDDHGKRPRGSPPGSPGGSDPSDGGGGRRGPQGPGGPRDAVAIDESTPLDQWGQ
eukprot:461640-Pyramimonas_sp.AAC.1